MPLEVLPTDRLSGVAERGVVVATRNRPDLTDSCSGEVQRSEEGSIRMAVQNRYQAWWQGTTLPDMSANSVLSGKEFYYPFHRMFILKSTTNKLYIPK